MKTSRIILVAFLACFLLLFTSTTISAVEGQPFPLKSDMKEVSFTASISNSEVEDVDVDQTSLMASIGYFLTEQHEVGLNIAYNNLDVEDNDYSAFLAHIFYTFNVPINQPSLVPYVGLQLGFGVSEILDTDADVTSFGLFGGVKYFFSPSTIIYVQPSYVVQEWDIDDDEDLDVTRLGIDIGIGILF